MNAYSLLIEEMHCGGCAQTISKIISNVDQAAQTEILLDCKLVNIKTSGDINLIISELSANGFEAKLL